MEEFSVMKKQKGSFTIEAVILISFMICMIMGILQEGIYFYQKSAKRDVLECVNDWDGVSTFYKFWRIKEMEEELKVE